MAAAVPRGVATILVVDDNAQNRALAEATLEDEGHEIVMAANGDEALAAFTAEIDCVLLDVRMPGMDGFEVCSRIRAMPHGAHTPILFLTAIRDLDTFDAAQKAGADDFLTKPVRPTELALRVNAALKLRQMNAELRESFDLVRQQRDDLMRLQLQKERLMAFVVHDLKNPVNAMDLYAQLLVRDTSLPESARESAQTIRAEARSLLRLILNLLDITKSDEGELEPNLVEFDLEKLAGEVITGHAGAAESNGLSLSNDVEVSMVRADIDLLRRVLENLIDNAIRHAPKGSTVRIAASANGGDIEVRVSDEGKGIPVDERQHIFERHVRLDGAVATRAGRGLGLAFCRAATLAHRGDIWVADETPGTTICVRIPQ
jgi:signal transduction histidine kinase